MSSSRSSASATRRKAPISPYAQVSPPPTYATPSRSAASGRGAPTRTQVAVSGPPSVAGTQHAATLGGPCYCPQCLMPDKRRPAGLWHAPSPYLEAVSTSLVISPPARRKLQLVPPRRYPAAISPYETLREASRGSARAQSARSCTSSPSATCSACGSRRRARRPSSAVST